MNKNIHIIPAILATSEQAYQEKLQKIEACPQLAEGWVQIDFMDNKFVQNQSIGPDVLAKYKSSLKLEAQLMVEYPENWIDELIKVGVARIVFPIEDQPGIQERIEHIKQHGLEVGLSLNPQTPLAQVIPFLGTIDLVLLMSVNPGFGGQKFIPEVLEKVKEIAGLRGENDHFLIEVDGGINGEVVKDLAQAGADNLVIGSHLIDGNITENLKKIQRSLQS